MGKIQETIAERGLKPSDCLYHTWRDAKNKENKYTGKVRILVIKGEDFARCDYKCPECGHEGYIEKEWKRPFSFKCEACGFLVRIARMKDEAKRTAKEESRESK